MQNVLKIIHLFGGVDKLSHIRIEGRSSAMMPLVIERIGAGPRGMRHVSVAHYYTQNGDAMRDPEITFEIGDVDETVWLPTSYLQDNVGLYQECVFVRDDAVYMRDAQVRSIKAFARMWDRNIGAQGYVATAEQRMLACLAQEHLAAHPELAPALVAAAGALTELFPKVPAPVFDETPLGQILEDNPLYE